MPCPASGVVARQGRWAGAGDESGGISFCPARPFAAKAPRMIISRRKFRRCPRSVCKRQSSQRSVIANAITGRAPFTPPTAGSGSPTKNSKSICASFAVSGLTWKRRRYSARVFLASFPPRRCCWCPINPWCPKGVKTATSDQKVTQEFLDQHLRIGIDSLPQLINRGLTVKHLRF